MGLGALLVSSALALSSGGDLIAPDAGPTGLSVRLWCPIAETGEYSVRRASLVHFAGQNTELALTAGHGLAAGQICELRVGEERLEAMVTAGAFQEDPNQDWAVVRAPGRFSTQVDRFQVAIAGQSVYSARIKLNSQSAPVCEVFPAPAHYQFGETILLHDCDSVPGRSGAPMLVSSLEGETIVGLNLGWIFDTGAQGDHRRLGYLRQIDDEIAAALLTAAD